MLTLEKLLDDFYRMSGVGVAVIDKQFHTVLMESGRGGESFCTAIHKSPTCLKKCLQSDKEAFHIIEKSREMYIYTCPFGLTEVMVPIFDDRSVIAYFFLVMGLGKRENRAFPVRRAMEFSKELRREKLQEMAENLPWNDGNIWETYFHLLTVMAAYIGKNGLIRESHQSLGEIIKSYVDKNIDRKITLAELSKKLHRSIVTLTECFRKEFGVSIMQYVFQRRMEAARQMLVEDKLSIGEIAYSCGFQDIEYFSRCFKREFGKPPSVWRKENSGTVLNEQDAELL